MSRKGNLPVSIPNGVKVNLSETEISVVGPKATLKQQVVKGLTFRQEGDLLIVGLAEGHEDKSKFHGLYRSLIQNMVQGASAGFERRLEMIGVGYRAAIQGALLDLQLGFSHPTKLPIPKGIDVKVEKNTLIIISGADKQQVGQFAATVRSMRPPEPYQGKGIRYLGEYVRKKAGKAASSGKGK